MIDLYLRAGLQIFHCNLASLYFGCCLFQFSFPMSLKPEAEESKSGAKKNVREENSGMHEKSWPLVFRAIHVFRRLDVSVQPRVDVEHKRDNHHKNDERRHTCLKIQKTIARFFFKKKHRINLKLITWKKNIERIREFNLVFASFLSSFTPHATSRLQRYIKKRDWAMLLQM